ncbi:hypothetical protein SAMN04487947_2808 [Halogeometricum rufum]|jgi:hypothetical protein|uniref:DUF8113 domain-containing protein n=1 Tax=Halogeometricum rufum TaxID=553469 RepID=A0A1I6I356_9EURY|nr:MULTISPECIES: hypothetical protein [Halogeometricum]MUV56114.1 hypothetical protein [Halogeometricum sp. CBA1124]SFR61176.1 hypothetical protein SAMN04487947_2808 [Halogeometricum rufum]
MSDSPDDPTFERVREQAAEALTESDAASLYVGLAGPDGQNEYYFANDVDDEELQEMAAQQLGMLTRVLAEQSNASIEQVTSQAAEMAKQMNVR